MKHRYTRLIALTLFLSSIPMTLFGLSLEEEKKYGREIYSEIARSAVINNDPYLSLYVEGMKKKLEDKANLPLPIILTVIESQSPDAFATIGGYVYVSTGLIGLCDREEELAGVLAHEFAHIGRRHVAKRMEKEKYINVGMLATMLLSMWVGDPKATEAILATGAASAQALSLKYSREDEDEADRIGSTISDGAGYGGLGIADFLKKLRMTGIEKTLPQYLLTHPYHEERIIRIENMWSETRTPKGLSDGLFPYLLVRIKILHRQPGTTAPQDIWISKYAKDRDDPLNAYGASLAYGTNGNIGESIRVVEGMKSPFRSLFLGEMYVNGRQYQRSIEVLRDLPYPLSHLFLAKAYEGLGDYGNAINELKGLAQYARSYPEIYHRLGMLLGRTGQEGPGYEYLGRYHLEAGRRDLARTNFEKAIAKYGMNTSEAREILKILDDLQEKKK
jgi:beta-barrel assembly-enhancing protease